MEAVIGIIAGTITYLYYYRKYIKIKKRTLKLIRKIMEDARRLDKLEDKIDRVDKRLQDLEVSLRVSLAQLQGKVARNASVVTAITMIAMLIIKEFIFK